jgi:hypothetical protein
VDVVALVVGIALLLVVLLDAFDTLLAINMRGSRFSPSFAILRGGWWLWRAIARRVEDAHRRETLLGIFGPLSFLVMLTVWVVGQLLGWALIWWALRDSFRQPIGDLAEAFYYSGITFFSVGFGDVLAAEGGVRLLTVIEAYGGLATLGLVIGYLPPLSGAYGQRERQLLLLDDLADDRMTPVSLIASHLGPGTTRDEVHQLFVDWTRWCADVFESHSSFPMLVLWRSKHREHAWIKALAVVSESANTYLAASPENESHHSAMRLHRESCALVRYLADRMHIEPLAAEPVTADEWAAVYAALQAHDVALRPFEESHRLYDDLQAALRPYLGALDQALLAPPAFWGVSSSPSDRRRRRPRRRRETARPARGTDDVVVDDPMP